MTEQEPGGGEPSEESPADVWMTDRSRQQVGYECPRKRYLEFHSGPSGYGIRLKARALPLIGGVLLHEMYADVMLQLKDGTAYHERRPQLREVIAKRVEAYIRDAEKKGLQDPMFVNALEVEQEVLKKQILFTIHEQASMFEGMAWAFAKVMVPQILKNWRVIAVEEEQGFYLQGEPGEPLVLYQTRPDIVLERRVDKVRAVWDYKSAAYFSKPWRKQFEDNAQLTTLKEGATQKYGEPVAFSYILGIEKGARKEEKSSGTIKQWSPFCYAYYQPANPPLQEEDWQLKYSWTDDYGKEHRLGKSYQRKTIWEHPFPDKPEGWRQLEYWVEVMPEEQLQKIFELLGPFEHDEEMTVGYLRGVYAGELQVREGLWRVYDKIQKHAPDSSWPEAHPEVRAELDRNFRQSFNCHPFGKDCQFLQLCNGELKGDPLASGKYELRRPHHQPELDQMLARGIEPPEVQEEDEGGGWE